MAVVRLRYVLLAMVLGCGPSFHAIYEGNARFEHCYALEESTQSGMKERADCWRDWSERYTYGQTRDRIQYATARYVALSQAPNVPTDEALMMAAPGMTPRVTTITAPAPTSPYHPPPKVLDEAEAGTVQPPERPGDKNVILGTMPDAAASPVPAPAASPASALPGEGCATKCSMEFRTCTPPDAGTCDKAYKTCMRGCFK
jgi:hypothetical protein